MSAKRWLQASHTPVFPSAVWVLQVEVVRLIDYDQGCAFVNRTRKLFVVEVATLQALPVNENVLVSQKFHFSP
jgi:hypothetical protein